MLRRPTPSVSTATTTPAYLGFRRPTAGRFSAPFIASGGSPISLAVGSGDPGADGDSNISTRTIPRSCRPPDITRFRYAQRRRHPATLRRDQPVTSGYNVTSSSATDASSQSIAFTANLPPVSADQPRFARCLVMHLERFEHLLLVAPTLAAGQPRSSMRPSMWPPRLPTRPTSPPAP